MSNKKITKFLQSFVAIPLLATSISFNGIIMTPNSTVNLLNNNNETETSVITTQEAKVFKERAEAINAYFKSKDAPLAGYGMKFVTEAEKHDIDYRLLAAIAMRESTGGKNACKSVPNSVFGYGSCKMGFKSIDESIEKVSASLGGNNPKTARYYKDKNTEQILKKYNPDHIVMGYSKQVIKIMLDINPEEVI